MSTSIETLERESDALSRPMRPSEVVYFTAAVGMLGDPLYDRAYWKVQSLHHDLRVLSAKSLWSSPKHWLSTYREVLADVTHVYILPYAGVVVGTGIVEEICYLDDRAAGAPLVRFLDHSLRLKGLHGFLKLPDPTNGRFARLCSKREARELGFLNKTPKRSQNAKRC